MKKTLHQNKLKTVLNFAVALLVLSVFSNNVFAQTYYGTAFTTVSDTNANIAFNYFLINNPTLNGDHSKLAFITHNYSPPGASVKYANFYAGLWYDGAKWSVYNEAGSAWDTGAAYNVIVPNAHGTSFTAIADSAHLSFNHFYIDNALTNNKPNLKIFVTHNYNPSGITSNVYNNNATGVFYSSTYKKWAVYNENAATFPKGAVYNVFVPDSTNRLFLHTADSSNTSAHVTFINNAACNNKPKAILIVTHNWNPKGGFGVYDTAAIGVYYTSSSWAIYNENGLKMPIGAAFNVLVEMPSNSAVSEINTKAIEASVYPNPAQNIFNITYNLKQEGYVDVKITNSIGQVIKTIYSGNQSTGNYSWTTKTNNLSAGLYFVTLTVNGIANTTHFIITH